MPAPSPTVLPTTLSDEVLSELLTDLRRHLHRHPETGYREHETSRYLRDLLTEFGFEVQGPLAGTGFYVDIEGAHPGPVVAYRTELDALAAHDAKRVPYASAIAGAAHLCGHDAHMAVAVGVALLLRERQPYLHGTARVLFQPNEESLPSGAPRMIADGVLDGVQEIFCIHADPTLPVGTFGLRAGAVTAASAMFMIHLFSEESGHSARPHLAVDTVWIASQILSQLYQLPGRVHDARRTAVLTVCRFRAGEALNVIPSDVEFGGTLRCVDLDALHHLNSRIEAVAKTTAGLHGAGVRYEVDLSLPPVVNDAALAEAVHHAVEDLFGGEAVYAIPEPSMGGEDFAFYLQHVPGMLVRVGTAGGPETSYPLHHACFDVDERALAPASRLMAEVVSRRLARPR